MTTPKAHAERAATVQRSETLGSRRAEQMLTAAHQPFRVAAGPAGANVVMGFYFFPRGGSAQVTRYLCRALVGSQWPVTLFAGSLGGPGESSNAQRFFSGISCVSLDYSAAKSVWNAGGDPMKAPIPMHASYEAKEGVPDRIFVELDDSSYDRQVASWIRLLSGNATVVPDLVHLHHLTPIHDAIRAVWPHVPIITHLHGPDLKMLAAVQDRTLPVRSAQWSAAWVARMRRWASDSARVVVVSGQDEKLVHALLPVDATRVVTIANGVDTDLFSPCSREPADRLAKWKRWLVDDPRGWRRGQPEGSISYDAGDLAAFIDCEGQLVPIVLFAGRFLLFKRVQLLIEAHHAMRSTTTSRSVLVVVGGFPGEWEGEHPYDTVRRLGATGVFFTGWRDHQELADILTCGDVFAAPSVDEPFGLVYLEAMSAGLPPIATNTGGPPSFINIDADRPTGWLVAPDDLAAMVGALTEAVSDPATRTDRGRRAAQFVRQRYSWAMSAEAVEKLYTAVVAEHDGVATGPCDGGVDVSDDRVPLGMFQLERPTTGVA